MSGVLMWWMVVLAGVVLAASSIEAAENLVTFGPEHRVALVRITDVSIPKAEPGGQLQFPVSVVYRAKVLADSREELKDSDTIEIHGEQGVQGSHPIAIPTWGQGDLCIMVLAPRDGKDFFEYAELRGVPLGVWNPAEVIRETEVDELKQAIARLGKIALALDQRLSRQEAMELVHSGKYHVWALGVAGLAAQGDATGLMDIYQNQPMTSRQVIWLERCMDDYLPDAVRPSYAQRHQVLLRFVESVSKRGVDWAVQERKR